VIDEQYNIVWANDVAKRLFGPDLVGKKCYTVYHRSDNPCEPCIVRRCFEDGKVHEHEREVIGADGNPMTFWSTASPAERYQDGRPKMVVEISRNITQLKRAEKEIRDLSRRLIKGMEEERKKLAQDLHDELSEVLTAVYFGMEALHNSIPGKLKDQRKKCMELIGEIEEIGDRIRNISSDLRPAMLDDLGLIPTIEWYISDFINRRQGIEIDLETIGVKKRLDPEIEIVLYRILQEGLNNIAKHAKASHVKVLLTFNHPKIIFTIKDDGVGFEMTKGISAKGFKSHGIGLAGLRERVASAGGSIDIRSRKGKGTLIRAELPIPEGKN
jgi:PAS domain S-box-containing protein